MALGIIPRFSPTFSGAEFRAATRSLLRTRDDEAAVAEFEDAFATYIGHKHAIMVPSARFAFYLLLKGWGVGEGDEVIVPALTYFAIPAMVVAAGATPVFADVGASTYTLDPTAFENAITERTRVVVPTHLFGLPCDMEPILKIAQKHAIRVVEDCAQSTGARYGKKRVGAFADATYYTFGLTKNITTLQGAMITTNDADLVGRVRERLAGAERIANGALWKQIFTGAAMMLATHPFIYPFAVHPAVRIGNAMGKDPIDSQFSETERIDRDPEGHYRSAAPRAAQARVGLKQLERLEDLNGRRVDNGHYLDQHLGDIPNLVKPTWPDAAHPIFMSYAVQHPNRDALSAALRRRGIDTTAGFMTDCASNPIFADHAADCPNARTAFERLLHIPVHPNLTARDRRHIVESLRLAAIEVDT